MLLQLADKLQDNSIIVALTSTGWTAAGLAILHYYSMFVLVGSMAIVGHDRAMADSRVGSLSCLARPRQDLGAAFAVVLGWGHPDGRRSAGDLGNRLSG